MAIIDPATQQANADMLRDLKPGQVYRISVRSWRKRRMGMSKELSSLARFGKVRRIIDANQEGRTDLVYVVFEQTNYDGLPNGRRFSAASFDLHDEPITLDTWHRADAELKINNERRRLNRAALARQRRSGRAS